mgnify:CR=1 FL=1
MMYFEKDLVNKAIELIDGKSKSDELKAFTDVNDINNMIRNLQINRDYQCYAIKLNQRLREEYPSIEKLLNLGRSMVNNSVLMRGTGFIGGKGRVCKIFETEIDAGTRAKRIKAEYGQGGAGWPVDGLGLHGYDTFHGNGLRFQWKDEDGEVEGYVSWKDIEKELGVLILTGEYQPETQCISGS